MSTISRRLGALLAAGALSASAVALVATPAQAATSDPRPVQIGGDWLAGQLTNGLMHNPNFGGFDDYGLTADTAFALVAVGGHSSTVTAIGNAMAPVIADWYDSFGTIYTGSLAKAAAFVQAIGADPTNYGGINLITALEGHVASTAPIDGRIENEGELSFPDNQPTDSANSIGQSFAVSALYEAGSTKAAAALTFLLKQQCSEGYFRLNLTENKSASDQTCDGGKATGDGAPDPDATSTAIRMLLPQIDSSPAAAHAIGKAEIWLLNQQKADGSFGGGTSTTASNANSTGLAGWVLGLTGHDQAATKAAIWVRSHQADEVAGCANGLTSQTGAVGYNDAGVTSGLRDGITDATADQWRRASSQALPVLQWAPPATAGSITASVNGGYYQAGSAVTVGVTGVTQGAKVCITGFGAPVRGVASADYVGRVRLTVPAGTGTRTFTATDRDGHTSQASLSALAAKKLVVKAAVKTVKRGKSVRVTVSGLAVNETVTLRYRGVRVAVGPATSKGTFSRLIKVGNKTGNATIAAFGQFTAIRKGATTIKVVR